MAYLSSAARPWCPLILFGSFGGPNWKKSSIEIFSVVVSDFLTCAWWWHLFVYVLGSGVSCESEAEDEADSLSDHSKLYILSLSYIFINRFTIFAFRDTKSFDDSLAWLMQAKSIIRFLGWSKFYIMWISCVIMFIVCWMFCFMNFSICVLKSLLI